MCQSPFIDVLVALLINCNVWKCAQSEVSSSSSSSSLCIVQRGCVKSSLNKTTYVKRAAESEGFPSSTQEGDGISVFVLTQSKATTTASSSVLHLCGVGTLGRAAGESLVIVWTWDDDNDLMIFRLLFFSRSLLQS